MHAIPIAKGGSRFCAAPMELDGHEIRATGAPRTTEKIATVDVDIFRIDNYRYSGKKYEYVSWI